MTRIKIQTDVEEGKILVAPGDITGVSEEMNQYTAESQLDAAERASAQEGSALIKSLTDRASCTFLIIGCSVLSVLAGIVAVIFVYRSILY
mmetsp:Transcript_7946/g.8992  ORF Transcript_7946/g.8992 Transcript_7946/m.8992 type:complete len:91 (-) Transcript_7946:448-720(-)|eukprot:CAMPEP_0204826626 /NCGR_PEP_ID=MMETSP1346-20131115/4269_1 /ASSEMBLY_ACC=CAM_ASM_000771 /TAXON_ID=215587 /ORGANISM="Aplanochytrium stocchinoi, Strain GSBS06" /LENGTH=90 /DNA_ID=CAMNT_0051954721 /DNA_START=280 /DNA_END=552 /DNA_ORIENTATION=-